MGAFLSFIGLSGGGGAGAGSAIGGVGQVAALSNPVTAVGSSLASIGTGIVKAFNHPFGTCAPNAPDADSFLSCWKHPIPNNQIPWWQGGARGWAFAICGGAQGGHAPSGGCQNLCDCSAGQCICAPAGAVHAMRDGSFLAADGTNLGPAVPRATTFQGLQGFSSSGLMISGQKIPWPVLGAIAVVGGITLWAALRSHKPVGAAGATGTV